jgi:hypothetical protein
MSIDCNPFAVAMFKPGAQVTHCNGLIRFLVSGTPTAGVTLASVVVPPEWLTIPIKRHIDVTQTGRTPKARFVGFTLRVQ